MSWDPALLAVFTALAVGVMLGIGLVRLAIALADRLGFLDRPGSEAHKVQKAAVPYGGGPAVLLAAAIALLAGHLVGAVPFALAEQWPVLVGAGVLCVMGIIDDRRALRARIKFIVQATTVISVVVLTPGLEVDSLRPYWPLGIIVAAAWIVLCINAYNLIDHADGFCAGMVIVAGGLLAVFSCLAWPTGAPHAIAWAGLIGALLGFLVWNAPPARVYLGDAGSQALGFLVACGTLATTFWQSGSRDGTPLVLLAPVLVAAVPLFDYIVVVIKRLRRGVPLFRGDRRHLSHRLVRLGLSQRAALITAIALQASLAASCLLLHGGTWATAAIVLVQAAGVLLAVVLLEAARDHE